ncbi:MAG: magnesium/cobalt transporter CorA [Chloroflexi bacterium]|nr:magnesium/cobalt transporter CorA [Chloroflexota bacterium]MDA1146107.1 magnesium/cobalt transporter CorA [Chloroflexota bacterium]
MSLTALHLKDGAVERLADPEAIAAHLGSDGGTLWVHVSGTTEADTELLGSLFGFHPLALQDCLNPDPQRPKIDDFGDYLFMLLYGVDHQATAELVVMAELDVFVGASYVVSASLRPIAAIEDVFERAQQDPQLLERSSGLLMHTLIDALVDGVVPTMDRMSDVTDLIEEAALTAPRGDLLPAILRLKRSALTVHRGMQSQRELLVRLARGDYALVPAELSLYFGDVNDHVEQISERAAALRERSDFATTTYLSTVTIRQNETMRVLAVVAAVFLPLTLVAGIYGMNFEHMPELGWHYGYFAVLAGMFLFGMVVMWLLWGRDWFAANGRRFVRDLHFDIDPPLLHDALSEAARLRRRVLTVGRFGDRSGNGRGH